jgi:hypothetical protein
MNEELVIDAEHLAEEIARYLAVVETFRAANCEPTWRPEPLSWPRTSQPAHAARLIEASTH